MAWVGLFAAYFVRSSADFAVGGRRMGAPLVAGALVGSFVGGTSTIGTAQLAYQVGVSAIWFTLGAGLSCLLMGFFLVGPLRRVEVETIPQLLSGAYGPVAGLWSAVYISMGTFIQIVAQILAAVPLLTSLFPVSPVEGALLAVVLVLTYILFGGFWGTSLIGVLKTVLLYAFLLVACFLSYRWLGGFAGAEMIFAAKPWFSLLPGGIGKELGAALSVVVGFVSTQTYLQPVFAARNLRAARLGVLATALLIPLAGAGGVAVGMFMRARHPGLNPSAALPQFIIRHLDPWSGGVALAALLISLILTGAALTLGVATVLSRDLYLRYRTRTSEREALLVLRGTVLGVVLAAFLFTALNLHTLILRWAFLSMALRGVTVFLPLLGALFFPGAVPRHAAVPAIALAPLAAVAWALFFPGGIDPFYAGMGLSALILAGGAIYYRLTEHEAGAIISKIYPEKQGRGK